MIRKLQKDRHYSSVRNQVIVLYDDAQGCLEWAGGFVSRWSYYRGERYYGDRGYALSWNGLAGELRDFGRGLKKCKKRNMNESFIWGQWLVSQTNDAKILAQHLYLNPTDLLLADEVEFGDEQYQRQGGDASLGSAVEEMVSEASTRLGLGQEATNAYDAALRYAIRSSLAIGIALEDESEP